MRLAVSFAWFAVLFLATVILSIEADSEIVIMPPGVDIEGHSACDLTGPDFVVVPCRLFEQLPPPPVDVDCSAMNDDGFNIQRCLELI